MHNRYGSRWSRRNIDPDVAYVAPAPAPAAAPPPHPLLLLLLLYVSGRIIHCTGTKQTASTKLVAAMHQYTAASTFLWSDHPLHGKQAENR